MNEEDKLEAENTDQETTTNKSEQALTDNPESTDYTIANKQLHLEENKNSSTLNLQPLNPDMEVHHHSHETHGKKNWKSYFWEFLMLFLAVFCGFLAEYQLEHTIEHQREKKYAESLLEDLKKDTIDLASDIPFWDSYIKRIDTLRNEIKKVSSQRDQPLLYRCVIRMRLYNNFNYNDRTIGQLKNGGNFRLTEIS